MSVGASSSSAGVPTDGAEASPVAPQTGQAVLVPHRGSCSLDYDSGGC